MKIGFIGLGKMGMQMTRRLQSAGFEVVATDPNADALEEAHSYDITAVPTRDEMVSLLPAPAVIWLMIPAHVVRAELELLVPLLAPESIVVDGGNSDFRDTQQNAVLCREHNVTLMDVGTSGGVHGLAHGFSMMIGGDEMAYPHIEPLIEALAQPHGYHYFGPSGSGHYVKMVHNAIEYGVMEAYAEGYRLLKESSDYPALDLAAVASVWQHGSIIASNLNGMTAEVLRANPTLDQVEGIVAHSGEADWALQVAQKLNIPLPAVQVAVDARLASSKGQITFGTKLQAALRTAFGGHPLNPAPDDARSPESGSAA